MAQLIFSFLICLTVGLSQKGTAQTTSNEGGYYIEETFFPVFVKKNDAQSSGGGAQGKSVPTENGFGYDLHTTLGYVWNQILVGLTYNYYQVDTSRAMTADYEGLKTSTNKQEFGPTIGYFWGPVRMALTYFVSAEKTFSQKYTDPASAGAVTVDETYKNTSGSGFQLALGYGFNLGGNFTIAPTLIYREVTYSKQSLTVRTGTNTPYDSSSPLASSPIDAELKPMVTVVFRF